MPPRSAHKFNRKFSMLNMPGLVFTTDPAAGDTGGGGAGAGQPGGQGDELGASGGAGGEQGRGFPPNTPWRDMKPEEQVAYWQHQARKHEDTAKARGDYDDIKAKAAKFDEAQRAAETEHEKALREAREQAKNEGRTEALTQANRTAVTALMHGALNARGRTPEQITKLLTHVNPDSFVKDGAPDTDAIIALVDDIAGPVTGGGRTWPDTGQGYRGGGSPGARPNSVAEVIEQRRAERATRQTSKSA